MCTDFQCLWIGPQSTAGTWSFCATRCSRFWPGECCSRSKFSFVQRDDNTSFFCVVCREKDQHGFHLIFNVPTCSYHFVHIHYIGLNLETWQSCLSAFVFTHMPHLCHYTVCVCVEKLSIFGLKIDPAGSHPWNVVHKLYVVATFKTEVSIYCPAWLSQV